MAENLSKIFTKDVIQHLQKNKDEITPELLQTLRKTKKGKQVALDILDMDQNEEGYYLDAFGNVISYKNIPSLKRINTKLGLSPIHIQEIKKCKEDIFYFLSNYVKIKTPKGVDFPDLRYYQLEFIDCIIQDENESIVGLLPRQSGKSISVGIYLVHLSLFEKDVNIGIAAQKHSMATEFLTKVKDIFVQLPIWMTPGIKAWNMRSISLENGVRILSDRAGSSAFRGHTCLRGDTEIEILEDNVEKTVTLDELYNKIHHSIKTNIKIQTFTGYKSFDGLRKVSANGLSIILEDQQINCTKDHRILCGRYKGGKIFRQSQKLKIGHKIRSNSSRGFKKIINITQDTNHLYYDPINVKGDSTYLVKNIIHHNCHYSVTDEAAYISGIDNNMSRFEAYLDSMLPSQSALSKKKNIFISTANGMNEFEILYSNAKKDGFDVVTEILDAEHIIYSDTIGNHYKSLIRPPEIMSIEPYKSDGSHNLKIQKCNGLKTSNILYKVQYQKRKVGSNNSIAFYTDWKKVPRYKQDGSVKTPNEFYEEILATKGEVFFNQAYGNIFAGSSYTLIESKVLRQLSSKEVIATIDGKLKVYYEYEKDHQYICSVDPAKDGVDGFVINFIDITDLNFKQVATANLQIDYLLMPEFLNDWCKLYGNPYLIIENNEGAGQSVADQMLKTYKYENLHFDTNKNQKNKVKAKKKYPGTRTTKTSRNLILKTLKTFIENNQLEINDADTIKQLYSFILKDNKYQAEGTSKDDCVMSLALAFTIFNNTDNFVDMKAIVEKMKGQSKEKIDISKILTIGNFDIIPEKTKDNSTVTFEGFNNFNNISEYGLYGNFDPYTISESSDEDFDPYTISEFG